MTNVIYYATTHPLTDRARQVLKRARALAYGEEEVDFIEAPAGPGALNLGHIGLGDDCVRTINTQEMVTVPRAEYLVAAAMRRYAGTFEYRAPIKGGGVLWMDTETPSADERWDRTPEEFMRVMQYAWDEEPVQFCYDLNEMRALVEQANIVVAHAGHSYDWSVMYGKDSITPLLLARDNKLFCSKVAASVLYPSPEGYVDRKGFFHKDANKPANSKWGWLSLDNLAFQFGVPGKEGDLKALAEEFGGFEFIPLDDPRFVAYMTQDVVGLRDVVSAMLQFVDLDDYDRREQVVAGINAQISRNGFRVDIPVAEARVIELAERKAELLSTLSSRYGFPTEGKAPWLSKSGKAAILALLADGGVFPEEDPDWVRTATKNEVSLGGKAIVAGTADTPMEETGQLLGELMGLRPLAQQALDFVRSDGFVHPEFDTFQRSGRTSVTEPGLTTWSSRDKTKTVEKAYFLPDSDDDLLVEYDFSQADARMVAAESGDTEYAKLFAPGSDMHETRGRKLFGDEAYDSDPVQHRNDTKPINHGGNYGLGNAKLAKMLKVSYARAKEILDLDKKAYALVTDWKHRCEMEARSGWITNGWGRPVPIARGQEHTSGPAMYGQSGTREIMFDGMIRMLHHDVRLIQWIKGTIHDAIVQSIPKSELDTTVPTVVKLMSCTYKDIEFPIECGKPGENWRLASHG